MKVEAGGSVITFSCLSFLALLRQNMGCAKKKSEVGNLNFISLFSSIERINAKSVSDEGVCVGR